MDDLFALLKRERQLRKLIESVREQGGAGVTAQKRERAVGDLGREPGQNKAHPERKETAERKERREAETEQTSFMKKHIKKAIDKGKDEKEGDKEQ